MNNMDNYLLLFRLAELFLKSEDIMNNKDNILVLFRLSELFLKSEDNMNNKDNIIDRVSIVSCCFFPEICGNDGIVIFLQ